MNCMSVRKILIIEDDEDIGMIEEMYLRASGFDVCLLKNGLKLNSIFSQERFDLVLLDLMLPGKDGYTICKEIREQFDIPILMVTARGESMDKVRGLEAGADDFIQKPFDPAELVARVRANLRQYDRLKGREIKEICISDLRIFPDNWKAFKKDKEIRLANKEFELLCFLAMHPNIVFSKEQLFEKVWGFDYMGDSATVMVHINRIREKIEEDSKNPKLIETVWGAGYRLNKKV